jgi:replicative DNA helicase
MSQLVVLDYLRLMRGDHSRSNFWCEMTDVVLAVKEIATELGTAILLPCAA